MPSQARQLAMYNNDSVSKGENTQNLSAFRASYTDLIVGTTFTFMTWSFMSILLAITPFIPILIILFPLAIFIAGGAVAGLLITYIVLLPISAVIGFIHSLIMACMDKYSLANHLLRGAYKERFYISVAVLLAIITGITVDIFISIAIDSNIKFYFSWITPCTIFIGAKKTYKGYIVKHNGYQALLNLRAANNV